MSNNFATLSTVAHQAPLFMRFSRQEYWSGLPCPSPGDLPHPGIEPESLVSPALAGRFFITSTTWVKLKFHIREWFQGCLYMTFPISLNSSLTTFPFFCYKLAILVLLFPEQAKFTPTSGTLHLSYRLEHGSPGFLRSHSLLHSGVSNSVFVKRPSLLITLPHYFLFPPLLCFSS